MSERVRAAIDAREATKRPPPPPEPEPKRRKRAPEPPEEEAPFDFTVQEPES